MTELSDYKRLVERPMADSYNATIKHLRAKVSKLRDALEKIESMSRGRIGPVHSSYADVQHIAQDALNT